MIKKIFNEINEITAAFVKCGLAAEQNFPIIDNHDISWQNHKSYSGVLKNIPYEKKYDILDQEKNYNIKTIDGALIQFVYRFSTNDKLLLSHRLAFYPSSQIKRYQDAPDEYENSFFENSDYFDASKEHSVVFPVRFDYSSDEKERIEIDHPYSHLHLGDYPGCRIPVCSPISPNIFINFILRNFYNIALKNNIKHLKFTNNNQCLSKCLGKEEGKIIHINID